MKREAGKAHPGLQALPIFAGETEEGNLMVGKEKFEMSELCQMFMGMRWKNFFTFCTALYNYGWYGDKGVQLLLLLLLLCE